MGLDALAQNFIKQNYFGVVWANVISDWFLDRNFIIIETGGKHSKNKKVKSSVSQFLSY